MPVKKPNPSDLEPIERASRSELQALQLERLRWSVNHAYENVPHYRAKFDTAGVKPSDLKTLADLKRAVASLKRAVKDAEAIAEAVPVSYAHPVRLLAFASHDCRLDLLRQLIAVAKGPTRSIAQSFQAALLVPLEDLVAGLP